MAAAPIPTTPGERVETLDILRGIALYGVMAINLVWGFRVSIFQRLLPDPSESWLDLAVEVFLWLVISGKALAIFSLLFGAGLAILAERLRRTGRTVALLLRRLAVLLIIGLIHLLLIWNGDILTEYAVAGFIALPFLFGSRRLLASGAASFLALSLLFTLFWPLPAPDAAWIFEHLIDVNRVHRTGGLADVLLLQLRELPHVAWWHVYALPRTTGLFLLGALIWRSGILRAPAAHRRSLKAVAGTGIAGGFALMLAVAAISASELSPVAVYFLSDLSTIVLALGYSAAVIVIATGPRAAWLAWAAPSGRMAFTNYLAQSVIFAVVFFGYGFGLFRRMSMAEGLAFGTAVYALQVVFSAWWLRHHRFGPVEWLWRTAMYGQRQPWRRSPEATATPPPSAPPPADRS